jgi:hypothetical protein
VRVAIRLLKFFGIKKPDNISAVTVVSSSRLKAKGAIEVVDPSREASDRI